ncbi:hypothetical protein CVT26_009837, partial [Gymnopilus dilepis]
MATREQPGPARVVRRDSSFLGTIKTIVTAPLSWLAPHDTPKRRRDSPVHHDDDHDRQSKRIRRNSPPPQPPRRTSSLVPRASSAVLPSARATVSPRRQPIPRTMSIDPPRRDPSF